MGICENRLPSTTIENNLKCFVNFGAHYEGFYDYALAQKR